MRTVCPKIVLRKGETWADVLIDELEFSSATTNLLKRRGIKTVAALIDKTEGELSRTPGFARRRIDEIKKALHENGLKLRQGFDVEPPDRVPIEKLLIELGIRIYNMLKKMDVETLGDLLAMSEEDLMLHPYFGRKACDHVVGVLASYNLHLRKE